MTSRNSYDNLSDKVLAELKNVWKELIKDYDTYPEDLLMFWHEDDFRCNLSHRLRDRLDKKSDIQVDIHANVKLETKEDAWGDDLLSNVRKAVKKIGRKNNYVDLVINRKQDIENPFLLSIELKYWYYPQYKKQNGDKLIKELRKDLDRLVILKELRVTEKIAFCILNVEYEDVDDSDFIRAVKEVLEEYKRKGVEILTNF